MRRLFTILFALALLTAASPSVARAASCSSMSGHCVYFGACFNGHSAPASGCLPVIQQCCVVYSTNPSQVGMTCTINGLEGINTAVGCIPYDWQSGGFISSIFTLAVGVGGGFALLLMLYGTFIITTSAGIPDKLKAGKEIITSAIIGLIFMIFSIVLMQLIGVDILGIPGL